MNKTLHLPISGRFSKWGSSIRWGLLAAASLLIIVLGGAACGGSQDLESAPQFSLTSSQAQEISLDELIQEHDRVVIVFYRGYF